MAKNSNRSELEIIHNILSITGNEGQSGLNISKISLRANLSHYAAIDKCQRLIDSGLLNLQRDENKKVYSLTEKGTKFFNEMNKFQELVQSFNLRI